MNTPEETQRERDALAKAAIDLARTTDMTALDALILLTNATGYVNCREAMRAADALLYELAAWFDDVLNHKADFETFYDSCADRCIPTADALTRSAASLEVDRV